MRIISLIPEATEILQALGLEDRIVEAAPPDLTAAQPDLIFTSVTEARAAGYLGSPSVEALQLCAPVPAVYALEPHSLGEILSDIKTVGDAIGCQGPARALIDALRKRIDAVSLQAALALAKPRPRRVACLQRSDPPIAAGWWLAELVWLAGGQDVLDGIGRPPRPVTWEQIHAAQPDLVLEGSHPGPGAVDLLEQMAALILPRTVGLRGEGFR